MAMFLLAVVFIEIIIIEMNYTMHNFQEGGSEKVTCRYDWHQVADKVTVAIYCKKYDPESSTIEINPVRLKVHVFFPEEGGSFDTDLHLGGVRINMLISNLRISNFRYISNLY